jgi:amino acid adenylation domain-containing protein
VLHRYLAASAARRPDHPAVEESSGRRITYRELDELSDLVRDRLVALGAGPGDRVGVCIRKSIDTVAAILGILKTGSAYVPVDPTAPAVRNGFILADCGVVAVLAEKELLTDLQAHLEAGGASPACVPIESPGGGDGLRRVLEAGAPVPAAATAESRGGDLAYILYTSGSTGKPKGVMLSHENAVVFVEWGAAVFGLSEDDRFSSHAPFHFDLSIFDLYEPLRAGATLVLVPEDIGKEPGKLAELIASSRITVWYSAPSILGFLAQYGRLPEHDFTALRLVLFAGEVFPVVHLRALQEHWPAPRYWNLYGPTETNVCTAFEVPCPVPADRSEPYPIGPVCTHYEGCVVDAEQRAMAAGEEGELWIRGPGVMQGYWNRPDLTEGVFGRIGDGAPWYRTGDVVVEGPGGVYRFVGRRDRMVKKRGYRVELGEIEACLYRNPKVAEAAVVALAGEDGVKVRAHLAARDGEKLSVIALKRFCAENLPGYMVPDGFTFHDALPKTSTDKIDYQTLANAN